MESFRLVEDEKTATRSPKKGYGYSAGPDFAGVRVGMKTANDYGHIIGLRSPDSPKKNVTSPKKIFSRKYIRTDGREVKRATSQLD